MKLSLMKNSLNSIEIEIENEIFVEFQIKNFRFDFIGYERQAMKFV